jgi:hypothetical protein
MKEGISAPEAAASLKGINKVPLNPVVEAAYRRLQEWLETGTPPPEQPRIEFAHDPAKVVRDEHGIARGGIRLPQIEVPLATNSAIAAPGNPLGFLGGSCVPFPRERVRALDGTATYPARFEQATSATEKAGLVLPRYGGPLIDEVQEGLRVRDRRHLTDALPTWMNDLIAVSTVDREMDVIRIDLHDVL